jgi:hypothetical protein
LEVHFRGVVIGLAANPVQNGSVAHAREFGVNVEVAAHETIVKGQYEQSVKRQLNVDECVLGTTRTHGTYELIHMASSVLSLAKKKRMAELNL